MHSLRCIWALNYVTVIVFERMVNTIEGNWLNWADLDFPALIKVNGIHIKLWLSFCCVLKIRSFDHVYLLHHVFSPGKMCDLELPFF